MTAHDTPEAALDLGSGVFVRMDEDGGGFLWKHPACKPWAFLRFRPDPRSSGHELVSRDPLTVQGSLLCPMGCGAHGFVRKGKWVPA